jgi:chemotaxis protein methyltransferase CheR
VSARSSQPTEDLELDLLVEAAARAYGAELRGQPRAMLRHAALELMESAQLQTLSGLVERMLHDRIYGAHAVQALSEYGLELFAESALYRAIRSHALPWLRTYPFSTIWAVHRGSGADVYSLAIVLEEEGLYDRTRIFATAPDRTILQRGEQATLPRAALLRLEAGYRASGGEGTLAAHFEARGEQLVPARSLKRNIVWTEYNPVGDGIFNEFNLVLCRDAIPRLDATLHYRMYRLLTDSLCMFGLLALGRSDLAEVQPYMQGYREWGEDTGVYQRVC